MTNEEWVKSLSTIELCKHLQCCNFCAYADSEERCTDESICSDGILEWLTEEHKDKTPPHGV